MKIEATSKLKTKNQKNSFSIVFDDGIIMQLNIDKKGEPIIGPLCAFGINSYYFKKGKYPTGKNLQQRVDMAMAVINKRQNMYKNDKEETTGDCVETTSTSLQADC